MTRPPPPRRPGDRGGQVPPDRYPQRRPPAGRPDAPTEQIRARHAPSDAAPTEKIQRRPPPPRQPPAPQSVIGPSPAVSRDGGPPKDKQRRRSLLRDPMSISLVAIIVLALVAGGLAGAELYARHRADSILVEVAECIVQDGATVSFGVNPPFLWQHMTGHYTNISVSTEGNQVQEAKGMQAEVTVEDVRLQGTADSKGTIGTLNATLTWTAAGIKNTVAQNLPGVGNLVTSVTTDKDAGTLLLDAGAITVTAKPVVIDGNLTLQVVDLTGPLGKDTVQTALDGLTTKLNDNYPLGIHADSVEVTATGVVGKFSTSNASIPQTAANPCFARL